MASPYCACCWACSIYSKYDNCNGCVLSSIFSPLRPEDLRVCIAQVGTADDLKATLMGMDETARIIWVNNVLISTGKRGLLSKLRSFISEGLGMVPLLSLKAWYTKAPPVEVIPRDTSIMDTTWIDSSVVINIPDDSVGSVSGERYHESSSNRESSGSGTEYLPSHFVSSGSGTSDGSGTSEGSGTEYLPSHFVSIPK